MGTRCDFYVGRGEQAEWLGSYPWDGYPSGIPKELFEAKDEAEFRKQVKAYLAAGEEGATWPEHGWPWPWDDSRTTDYAYAFDGGKVWASSFGYAWFDPLLDEPELVDDAQKVAVFPNMKERQKVTMGKRSGLLIVGLPNG